MPDTGARLAFVIVVESGPLEWQSVLFVDSLRRWGGRLSDATVYCASPRADRLPRAEIRGELEALGAIPVDGVRNPDTSGYGTVNRIVAGAHLERETDHEILVIADSDTLVLAPPDELALPSDVDVAARPVDVVGISTAAPGDSYADYWLELCALAGVDLSALPPVTTAVTGEAVVANYNGGLVAVRRELGILSHLESVFFAGLSAGLRPRPGARVFRTGTGVVPPAVAELWGAAQVALAVVIWSRTARVRELPPAYNVPLHKLSKMPTEIRAAALGAPVHVHYHWLLDAGEPAGPVRDGDVPLTPDQRAWLETRLRWRDTTAL